MIQVTSDKIVPVIGTKGQSTILTGTKEINSLVGRLDKNISLIGNTLLTFSITSDKIVNLNGNKIASISGSTLYPTLLGTYGIIVPLTGDAPYSFFSVRADTTYKTADQDLITADRT